MTDRRVSATLRILLPLLLTVSATVANAARVSVKLDGVEGELRTAVLAALELDDYTNREVTRQQVRRLYRLAKSEIQTALEPYGHYNVQVKSELKEADGVFVVVLNVDPGPPVKIIDVDIRIDGEADGLRAVEMARAAFSPQRGQRLEHASYERSKAAIHAALFSVGYLDATLVTHRVEVTRAANTASIILEWEVGERFRFGETRFEGGQFPEPLMQRFIPWDVDDYYAHEKLLELQQRLSDANYFSISQVQPDTERATGSSMPIRVDLSPAKRTVYTGGLFVGTDTGLGVRAGVERRWVNDRGHTLKFETLLAQRLLTLATLYKIPLFGRNDHSINFGVAYLDEDTDTSQSKTLNLAATDSRIWHGWTRTLGLRFLTGDFTVADEPGNTTLLYPEFSLSKIRADSQDFPLRGWSLTLTARAAQEGVLADTSFAQVIADAKWVRGLGDNSRFIARGSAGYTEVDDFDKLPPALRFFAGGDRSIRGYAFESVGPRILSASGTSSVIGGKQLLVASAEYEYYFSEKWGAAIFVDAGDAFTGDDFDLTVGSGLGVRWRSPVGMVRVDLGVPVNNEYASGVELHINIGPDL